MALLNQAFARLTLEPEAESEFARTERILSRHGDAASGDAASQNALLLIHAAQGRMVEASDGELSSGVGQVLFNWGTKAHLEGQLDQAVHWYAQAAAVMPSWAEPVRQIGLIRRSQEDWSGAAEAFERVAELEPDNRDHWFELGQVYSLQQNWDGSVQAFRQGIDAQDGAIGTSNLYYLIGDIKQRHQQPYDYAAALYAYDQAVLLNDFADNLTQQVDAYHQRGILLGWYERWSEAVVSYQQAIVIKPDSYWVRLSLATAYIRLNESAAAERVLLEAIELHPDRMEAYRKLGELLIAQGDTETAVMILDQALQRDPDNQAIQDLRQGIANN